MSVNDPVFGDLPKPKMKRHDRIVHVSLQTAIGFDQNILHDIADVDSFLDFVVQSHSHQLPKRVSVSVHQLIYRRHITVFGLRYQLFGLELFWPHNPSLTESNLLAM